MHNGQHAPTERNFFRPAVQTLLFCAIVIFIERTQYLTYTPITKEAQHGTESKP